MHLTDQLRNSGERTGAASRIQLLALPCGITGINGITYSAYLTYYMCDPAKAFDKLWERSPFLTAFHSVTPITIFVPHPTGVLAPARPSGLAPEPSSLTAHFCLACKTAPLYSSLLVGTVEHTFILHTLSKAVEKQSISHHGTNDASGDGEWISSWYHIRYYGKQFDMATGLHGRYTRQLEP